MMKNNSDGIFSAPLIRFLTTLLSAVNAPMIIRRNPAGITYLSCIPRNSTSLPVVAIRNFHSTLPNPARKHRSAPMKKTALRIFTPSMIAAIPKNSTGMASTRARSGVN